MSASSLTVPDVTVDDRTATRDEVLAARQQLRRLAAEHRLTRPGVDAAGAVVVTMPADDLGYGALKRFAAAASEVVGSWVNVVAADAPGGVGGHNAVVSAPRSRARR